VWFCDINNIKMCDCDGWRSETTNVLYILTSDIISMKMLIFSGNKECDLRMFLKYQRSEVYLPIPSSLKTCVRVYIENIIIMKYIFFTVNWSDNICAADVRCVAYRVRNTRRTNLFSYYSITAVCNITEF